MQTTTESKRTRRHININNELYTLVKFESIKTSEDYGEIVDKALRQYFKGMREKK